MAFCSYSCCIFHLGFFSLPKLGFIFGFISSFLYISFFDFIYTLSPLHTLSCFPTRSALNFLPQLLHATKLPMLYDYSSMILLLYPPLKPPIGCS